MGTHNFAHVWENLRGLEIHSLLRVDTPLRADGGWQPDTPGAACGVCCRSTSSRSPASWAVSRGSEPPLLSLDRGCCHGWQSRDRCATCNRAAPAVVIAAHGEIASLQFPALVQSAPPMAQTLCFVIRRPWPCFVGRSGQAAASKGPSK